MYVEKNDKVEIDTYRLWEVHALSFLSDTKDISPWLPTQQMWNKGNIVGSTFHCICENSVPT